jgi:DNA-binding beta-propeller fold protein YncE
MLEARRAGGRTHARALAGLAVGAPLLALTLLLLLCSTASAFRGHAFASDFGWGVNDGKAELQTCSTACKAGIAGSGNGQFNAPSAIAVNQATGHVYVLDQGNARIQVFGHDEKYILQFDGSETPAKAFSFGTVALSGGIAVDNACFFKKLSGSACTAADPSNGDVYVTDPGNKVVDKFSAEGTYLGQLEQDCGNPSCPAFEFTSINTVAPAGVAVDANGTVWAYQEGGHTTGDVDSFTNGEPSRFASARQLENVGSFVCPGFAVDSEDLLYARRAANPSECTQSTRAFKFATSGSALIAPFAEEETSAVAVDLASDEVFLDNVSSIGAFDSSAVEQERFGEGQIEEGAGLSINHENATDSTVYVADAAANRIDVFGPEPPGPPIIAGQSLIEVTADSATFQGEVNPHGSSSEFHFEYGRCTTPTTCAASPYEQSIPVPEQVAGSDFEVHSVSANPQDLLPASTYHFRLVAHNALNPAGTVTEGEEQIFTTQAAGVFELPDERAWEMVSPPDKHGAGFLAIGAPGVVQASASGDAITYLSNAPSEAVPPGNAFNSQILSTRTGSGWSTRDIAPPHESATGQPVGEGQEYRFFASDLSAGVVQRFGAFTPSLSPAASEQTPYLVGLSQACVLGALGGCYAPLVSACPPEGEECPSAIAEHANAAPGSVFGEEGQCPSTQKQICGPVFVGATADLSHIVLNSKAPLLGGSVKGALYEWSGGRLSLVSVLPGGEAVAGELGERTAENSRGAISTDGARVVWMTNGAQPHLYLYETAKEESIRLDEGLSGTPEFQLAAADTSKVLFTDNGDLYEYDATGEVLHQLTSGAEVVGRLPGASEDGSFIYFVANSDAPDGTPIQGAVKGGCGAGFSPGRMCNLYVLNEGQIGLVAVLSGEDNPDWNLTLVHLAGRVSPDGHQLAFMSNQPLSGYDNRDAHSGKRDEEVFVYDAVQQRLSCASCDPTGVRPSGQEYQTLGFKSLVGGDAVWRNQQWLAATIPGWTPYKLGQALNQSRYLSNSGRLFFNSHEALSPQDVNGTWDVYESEPAGVGSCTGQSPSFNEHTGACVSLISSGTSPEESGFLDASEDGSDVFFLTASKLSRQDTDSALDVYDAQICSAASPCPRQPPVPAPPCSTEASCRAAPAVQPDTFGSPPSQTFAGIGNVTPEEPVKKPQSKAQKLKAAIAACHKKYKHAKKKRAACERKARARYGKAKPKAKKAGR